MSGQYNSGGGYPRQYPTQPQGQPQGQPQYGGAPPPQYVQPPRPQYAQHPQHYCQPPYQPPQQQHSAQYSGYSVQGLGYPRAVAPAGQPAPQVVGHGTFDAGARFNASATRNIPPPPPGTMPTAAQNAAAYGGTVTMGQNRSGFFTSGSDGGTSTHID